MTFKPIDRLERLFGGYPFASFMISVLLWATIFLTLMLFAPVDDTRFGAFAADFKTWCFNYDPSTGRIDWTYATVMILNPLMLIGVVAVVWWEPMRTAASDTWTRLVRSHLYGLGLVMALAAGLFVMGPTEAPSTELTFPAERLRTAMEPPSFELWNQNGEPVRLEDLRGRVVMVTAVYASCHTACPVIITQAKRALNSLTPAQRDDVTVVAITLDPENDTQKRLAMTAKAHNLEAPEFNFVNGDDPQEVEDLLDAFSFSRAKDPETGVIDHANMFVLIDRDQKIAYRLTLGDRHQNWLETALGVLVSEE